MKIGLLFGSKSTEHEISIITMLQVREYINDEVYLLYLDKEQNLFLANNTKIDDYTDLNKLNKKFKEITFVKRGIKYKRKTILLDSVVILNHGKNGEDGMSAAILDFYDIPYVGSSLISSAVLLDKNYTHDILRSNNFLVTKSVTYTYKYYLEDKKVDIFPCIIKPSTLGSSIGIQIVKEEKEMKNALTEAFKYDRKLIIEELLEDFIECNIACYYDKDIVISNIEKIKKDKDFLSFHDKYEGSNKLKNHIINPKLDEEVTNNIKKVAREVYELFSCSGIIRIDLMIKDSKVYVNEINTIPGALSSYLFDDYEQVLNSIIKNSIIQKQEKEKLINAHETNILSIKSIKK